MISIWSAPVVLCFTTFGTGNFCFLASTSDIGSKLFFLRAASATSRGSEGSGWYSDLDSSFACYFTFFLSIFGANLTSSLTALGSTYFTDFGSSLVTGKMSWWSDPVVLSLKTLTSYNFYFLASASKIGSNLFFLRAAIATSSGSEGSGV